MGKFANFFIASETNNYHPPVLSAKAFVLYGVVLILLRLFLGATVAAGSGVDSQILMSLVNNERRNRQIVELFVNPKLLAVAAIKSQDMIDRDYFAHVDPDGNYVWERIVNAGYFPYKILGENLAINFNTAEGMVAAWLQSPKHRDNLLNPDFEEQGLSALYGDYKGTYSNLTTNLFGTLMSGRSAESVKAAVEKIVPAVEAQNPPPGAKSASAPSSSASAPLAVQKTSSVANAPPSPADEPVVQDVATGLTKVPPTNSLFIWARIIFTGFGLLLLLVLAVDSVIIFQHEAVVGRSHSSYHLSGFVLLTLVSILVWWW